MVIFALLSCFDQAITSRAEKNSKNHDCFSIFLAPPLEFVVAHSLFPTVHQLSPINVFAVAQFKKYFCCFVACKSTPSSNQKENLSVFSSRHSVDSSWCKQITNGVENFREHDRALRLLFHLEPWHCLQFTKACEKAPIVCRIRKS